MTLRNSVRTFSLPRLPNLPEEPRVVASARELARHYDAERAEVTKIDAEQIIARFKMALLAGDWEGISRREWKAVPWVAFSGPSALAENTTFFDRLITQYRVKPRRASYQALIHCYLREFDPAKQSIIRLAAELDGVSSFFEWPWRERNERASLFAPDRAARRIAQLCLQSPDSPLDVLESLGMGGGRSSIGLAARSYFEALTNLRDALAKVSPDVDALHHVLTWSASSEGLRYPQHRGALATALLLPWSGRKAPADIQTQISEFLLRYFKDPRLPANAKDWLGVPEEARAVLRKWLSREALEQFCQVIDSVAQERMWRYRRAFWLAYYNKDVVSDAWVLFGPEALRYAERAFGATQSYGILNRSPQVERSHSVLILQIGKLTVADWSHNGKCHIWRDGNASRPKLYMQRYTRDQLVSASDNGGQVHYGSEYYSWQGKIESYIRKHTGIALSEQEYAVGVR